VSVLEVTHERSGWQHPKRQFVQHPSQPPLLEAGTERLQVKVAGHDVRVEGEQQLLPHHLLGGVKYRDNINLAFVDFRLDFAHAVRTLEVQVRDLHAVIWVFLHVRVDDRIDEWVVALNQEPNRCHNGFGRRSRRRLGFAGLIRAACRQANQGENEQPGNRSSHCTSLLASNSSALNFALATSDRNPYLIVLSK
jgi:hypothetical protein